MWETKIREYCAKYNIPIDYLPDIIKDPKVVPMIRGKAFEFSVLMKLQNIIDTSIWTIQKLNVNAQFTIQDEDLTITHIPTGKKITLECKLAAKEKYNNLQKKGLFKIQVKCMRSRTLGEQKVKKLSPIIKVEESILKIHNDQYLPADFDLVVTSIGNAFYTTDENTGDYIWNPDQDAIKFLQSLNDDSNLNLNNPEILKDFAFNQIYIAKAFDLAVITGNQIKCSRNKCQNKENCGFIPNYPTIFFDLSTFKVNKPWHKLENCVNLLATFLG